MYAIDGRQSIEFIEFMIREMGADVDARADEPYGSTLRHACRVRRADVVETLVRASSEDVSERDAFVPHTAFGFFTGTRASSNCWSTRATARSPRAPSSDGRRYFTSSIPRRET